MVGIDVILAMWRTFIEKSTALLELAALMALAAAAVSSAGTKFVKAHD